MNLILISHHTSPRTGGHRRFDMLVRYAIDQGHNVVWLTPRRDEFNGFSNLAFLNLPDLSSRKGFLQLRLAVAVLAHVRRLRALRACTSVVVSFGETNALASLAAAILSRSPMSLGIRSDIERRYRLYLTGYRGLRKVWFGVRFVISKGLWSLVYRRAGQITVQTPNSRDAVIEMYGVRPERIATIPNALPGSDVRGCEAEETCPARPRSCIFVGNEGPIKGYDVIRRAAPRLRTVAPSIEQLTVVGIARESATDLQDSVLGSGLRIGWYPRLANVISVMAEHDMLIIPSREDQFPNVLLEALSVGVAAIGSDVDGIAYVLQDEFVLFAPGDSEGMLSCLERAATVSGYARALMISRKAAQSLRFDWPGTYLELVMEGLGERHLSLCARADEE